MPRNGKSYGRVKVKKINPALDDIPKDCGYMKQFEHNIDMNSNGIMGDCIEWCQINCEGKWGWWFEGPPSDNPYHHNWQEQDSYMSFEKKTDATKFWLAIGVANMGDKSR
jgi:hypothetical protein|tara:strand:+ start:243 stop:572 length:330 start_codon:yes stop_codon:yes gene_type:complete